MSLIQSYTGWWTKDSETIVNWCSKMHFASNRKHGLKIESQGLVTSTITRSAKNNQHTCTIVHLGVWEISFEDCYPPCRQSIAVQDWHYPFHCGPSDNKTLQLVRMVRLGVLMTCLWSWLIDIKSVKSLSYDVCVLWVMIYKPTDYTFLDSSR